MLDFLRKLGRPGGALAMLGAVVSGAAGWWLVVELGPFNGTPVWSPPAFVAGLVGMFGAPVLFGFGVLLLIKGGPARREKLGDDELRALLSEGRPLLICLDCRLELTTSPCDECGQRSSCFEARTAAERDTALVLLGLRSA